MRIDKLLWFLRLAKKRSVAQEMAAAGHLRINGRRVERAHLSVAPGDILTIPIGRTVRVIEILAIPARRGPAAEAESCYRVLDAALNFPIAAAQRITVEEEDLQP